MSEHDGEQVQHDAADLNDYEALSWPLRIELEEPIAWGKDGAKLLEAIEFAQPTAGMFFDLPANEQVLADFFKAASSMTGQPLGILRRLGPVDAGTVLRVVRTVLQRFLD